MNGAFLLLVMLGGGIGSVFRYSLSRAIIVHFSHLHFPIATLTINILGSLLIGFFSVLFISRWPLQEEYLRAFFMVGILGGFTTFSTFSLESYSLIYEGFGGRAFLYVLASVTFGLLGTYLGIILGKLTHA